MNITREDGAVVTSASFDRRKLAGFGYMAADAALFIYGLLSYLFPKQEADKASGKGMMVTGLGWGIGGLALAKYGKQPVIKQLERVENKLYAYLKDHGVSLNPEELALADKHKKRSLAQKLEDFCYDNPTEVLNSYYGLAALGMLYSGVSKGDRGEITAASCVIAGALAGIFIKEKSPRELENAGMLDKLLHKNPLSISSALYMINNVGSFQSARAEQLKTRDPNSYLYNDNKYLLKYGMASLYVASNLMAGSSSKKAGGEPEEHAAAQEAVLHSAARLLGNVSPAERELLAVKTAEYLVKQKELRLEDRDPKELALRILTAVPQQQVLAEDATFQRKLAEQALSPEGFSRN